MPRRYLSRAAAISLVLAAFVLTATGIAHHAPEASRAAAASAKPGKPAAFFSLLPPGLLP
ncbi:MAG: hypothetical protein Q4B94_02130 [Pseudomonadota bacterium]|nr:hypothetical protein [Pseudomonadota bacterium]